MGVGHIEAKAACRHGLDTRSGIWKTIQRWVGRILCSDAPNTSPVTSSASCSLLQKQTDEDDYLARQVQEIYKPSFYASPSPHCGRLTRKSVRSEVLSQKYHLTLPVPLASAPVTGDSRSIIDLSAFLDDLPSIVEPIIKKTSPETLVERMFPALTSHHGARYLAACFWCWLCILDDLTEGKDTTAALQQCIVVLCLSPYDQTPLSPLVSRLMGGLRHAVQTISIAKPDSVHGADTIFEPWKMVFWFEVQAVARALLGENDLEDAKFTMIQWLDLRVVTISARPLLVLLGASCGLSVTSDTLTAGPLTNLPLILGLENDILGFDKDHNANNPLSAVQLLIRDGLIKKRSLLRIADRHNSLVKELVMARNQFRGSEAERFYVNTAASWPNAMIEWMLSCERYKVNA
ncbi:MAG: hypothetical protein ALECFALPRED_003056 [Alectoria fallacina]|uniref:Uncharacterized protein n=1 Tax=Alectoria fallacina TaxID=1903189 RepID=A0A8H3EKI9_9LECA|nr:MAG: hypothetical protein ALECFALPRED_003056 [Alectoria fallacina]